MARKEKSGGGEDAPAWLVTFSDLMTLLLTFFVLLLSMAVIDERRKMVVIGSVSSTFSASKGVLNPKSPSNVATMYEPGAITGANTEDLQALKDAVFEDKDKDINFQQNRVITIISISNEVMFSPGSATLSKEGIMLLDKILPYLQNLKFPMLIAGHTGPRRDEEGVRYSVNLSKNTVEDTWNVSFNRCVSVYQHFRSRGLDSGQLSMEAFGQYRPHFSNDTPEGRMKNRRVDLVIDTREQVIADRIKKEHSPELLPKSYYFRDFKFDLKLPDKKPAIPGIQVNPLEQGGLPQTGTPQSTPNRGNTGRFSADDN